MDALCVVTGGDASMQLFVCKDAGCADNVSKIFCQDQPVFTNTRPMAECTGPPALNTVCRLGGRAILSTVVNVDCEFEGKGVYIQTKKCAGRFLFFKALNCRAFIHTILQITFFLS